MASLFPINNGYFFSYCFEAFDPFRWDWKRGYLFCIVKLLKIQLAYNWIPLNIKFFQILMRFIWLPCWMWLLTCMLRPKSREQKHLLWSVKILTKQLEYIWRTPCKLNISQRSSFCKLKISVHSKLLWAKQGVFLRCWFNCFDLGF